MSGGCLEGVWKVSGRCLEGVWMAFLGVLGRFGAFFLVFSAIFWCFLRPQEVVWNVSGWCLELFAMFVCKKCLRLVLSSPRNQEDVWKAFVRCLEGI